LQRFTFQSPFSPSRRLGQLARSVVSSVCQATLFDRATLEGADKQRRRNKGMKRKAMRLLLLVGLGSFALTACETSRPVVVTPTGQVVVTEPPPPPRKEVVGTPPGAQYVWVQGYWTHTDNRWVWIPGHWQVRPTATSTWVAGHWDRTPTGWLWSRGHWE